MKRINRGGGKSPREKGGRRVVKVLDRLCLKIGAFSALRSPALLDSLGALGSSGRSCDVQGVVSGAQTNPVISEPKNNQIIYRIDSRDRSSLTGSDLV